MDKQPNLPPLDVWLLAIGLAGVTGVIILALKLAGIDVVQASAQWVATADPGLLEPGAFQD